MVTCGVSLLPIHLLLLPSPFEAVKSAQRLSLQELSAWHGVSVQIIWKQVPDSLGRVLGSLLLWVQLCFKKGWRLLPNVQHRTENDMVPLQAQAEHSQALHIRGC